MRMRAMGMLLVVLVVGSVWAANQPVSSSSQDAEKYISNAKGRFDMTKQPRPFGAFLILDQAGNRYPSFWCGKNAEGVIVFDGRHDLLDDKLVVDQTGWFAVQLTTAARKVGMYDRLPGGVWVEKLVENNFLVRFDRFTGAKFAGTRADEGERGAGGKLIKIETAFSGSVSVAGKTAPISGTAVLEFSDNVPLFRLVAKFDLPGEALGLAGEKGKGITATLYTSSALVGADKPSIDTEPAGDLK